MSHADNRKSLQPQYLSTYDVWVEDSGANSKYIAVNRIPPMFTIGRNSFLLGASAAFKPGSRILIEILDSEGNPIFQTPVPTYVEGQSRLISVEIYEDTVPGIGTLIIMGELDSAPLEWKSKFNYRWSSQIIIEPNRLNSSPILFQYTPAIDVVETRILNKQTSSFTVTSQSFTASLTPWIQDNSQMGYLLTAQSPFQFRPDHSSVHVGHIPAHISGTLSVGIPSTSVELNLEIDGILNSSTAFAQNVLRSGSRIIDSMTLFSGTYATPIFNSSVPVTSSALLYYDVYSETGSTVASSYAQIRAYNLATVSGELNKVRISARQSEVDSNFKLIADVPVPTIESIRLSMIGELLYTASQVGHVPIGNIYQYLNRYTTTSFAWFADKLELTGNPLYPHRGVNRYYSSSQSPTESYTINYDNSVLLNSIFAAVPVVGSQFTGSVSSSGYFIGTPTYMELFENTDYELAFSGYYRKTSGSVTLTGNDANIDIYLIGDSGTTLFSDDPLGQKLGTVSASIASDTLWVESKEITFSPNLVNRGFASLRFVIRNGFWNLANISVTPLTIPGFSPDEFTILVPNTEYYNSLLQYKVEFLDINNNSINISAESVPVYFTGSVIDLGILP